MLAYRKTVKKGTEKRTKHYKTEEKDMKTARKLNFSDTFRIARIIKAAKITVQDIVKLTETANLKKDATHEEIEAAQNAKGMEMIGYIIDKAPEAEEQIYSFLGSISGVEPKNMAKADVTEIIELVADIFASNKDIKSFFTSALRSATTLPLT